MAQISKLGRKKLSEVLVEEGLLREEQVQETCRRQRGTGEGFGEALVAQGFATELDIARSIVKQFGLPYLDASQYRINKDGLQAVPPELMWQNQLIVLDKIGKSLLVAVSGVLSGELYEKLEKITGSQIFVYVSTAGQVIGALQKNVPLKAAAPAAAKATSVTKTGGTTVTKPAENK